jgi:23S rRNA A1618 N6-methylase RlmF
MADKVSALESKVQQLEQENKWLKELVTAKEGENTLDKALEARLQKEVRERSSGSHTTGVGTESA